ncbi:MAG: ABC transporter ATP-binding protein [Candidatus Lokiarchaeota archaeon]|nr:ABC transporter ATP-binding protein [Candidatus Lokiarchaeota archaeon]
MNGSPPSELDTQIITKNLSFIYESAYKENRGEIDSLLKEKGPSFKDDPKLDKFKALNSIDLSILKGKFIAMVGDTGSGKSTLVRTFNGLIPSFYRGIFFGYVNVLGKDTIQEKVSALSQHVGLVFQNPDNQLVAMTVEREIAFGLENLGMEQSQIREKLTQIMEYLKITHLKDRHPYDLSGGEKQRVAIASILTLEPSVIILDEPTATLDPQAAQSVLNLLKKLNEENKITIIIIEHRLEVILPFCNEIIVMNQGNVLEHGPTQQVLLSSSLQKTGVRIPEYIQMFLQLREKAKYSGTIPTNIDQAVLKLKEWLN